MLPPGCTAKRAVADGSWWTDRATTTSTTRCLWLICEAVPQGSRGYCRMTLSGRRTGSYAGGNEHRPSKASVMNKSWVYGYRYLCSSGSGHGLNYDTTTRPFYGPLTNESRQAYGLSLAAGGLINISPVRGLSLRPLDSSHIRTTRGGCAARRAGSALSRIAWGAMVCAPRGVASVVAAVARGVGQAVGNEFTLWGACH